jgi:hypothetical protein
MSDVLLMSALEVSDPVAAFVHVKINDLLHHSWQFCCIDFYGVPFNVSKAGLRKHSVSEE